MWSAGTCLILLSEVIFHLGVRLIRDRLEGRTVVGWAKRK